MGIPKKLTRVTKHRKPLHQLYQPGFNSGNGCWLEGGWVTVPGADFPELAKGHEKLYAGLWDRVKKQHYRDSGVLVAEMTPAQRQAWAYYSGEGTLEIRYVDGSVGACRVELAAGMPKASSLDWMRREGMRVIPRVLQPNGPGGELVVDQTEGIPADLLTGDTEPVDVWSLVVRQNRDRSAEFSKAMLDVGLQQGGLALGVALHGLIELEEDILRFETQKRDDPYDTLDDLRKRYQELRANHQARLGTDFECVYAQVRQSHNQCARHNLDNTDGVIGGYVLPVFHPDGTHEPLGPRDFPWGRDDGVL